MTKSVLSFGAHPDDIEIGCGGTELKLINVGYEVNHVYVTSGEAGSREIEKEKLALIREREAREAAKSLGVKKVEYLRYPDGLTSFSRDMKIEVMNLIRETKPSIIFVHSSFDEYPDHKVVNKLVMSAILGAEGPWFQESIGEPWSPSVVLGYEVWHPILRYQVSVDITKTITGKMKALACYASQVGATKYDEAFMGLARYRGVMTFSGEYAEVFEVLRGTLEI